MDIIKVVVSNGQVTGCVVNMNGDEKQVRLAQVQSLLEKNKIQSGAKMIDGKMYLSPAVLKQQVKQSSMELSELERDTDGNLVAAVFKDGRRANIQTAWSLAADNRIKGLGAAYIKSTNSKILLQQ